MFKKAHEIIEIEKVVENTGNNYCEKALGGRQQLNQAAKLWLTSSSLLRIIATHELIEYISNESNHFTKEQIDAFREGLSVIPAFLAQAAQEVELLKKLDQEKKEADNKIKENK